MHTANEIPPVDVPIGEQGPAVQAAPVQDGYVTIVADDDEVHVADQCARGLPLGDLAPHSDFYTIHGSS